MVRICRSGAESGKVWNWNWKGLELEGLGFNLCVALSHIVMSLISEGQDQRLEIGDDFIDEDKSQIRMTRGFQVVEQEEDLSD